MEPKYRQVADELARRLQAGRYAYGSRLPGHSALAREFGVSSITSNRALAELEARHLVQRVERAGTFALPPVTRLGQVILIMAREPASAGAMQMDYWRGLTPAAEASGVAVRVCSPQDPTLGSALEGRAAAGVGLISVMTEIPASLLRQVRDRRVPHVALGMEDEQALYCVTEDRRRACRALVEAMLADGATRFGFIGKIRDRNHRAALDGFRDALGSQAEPAVERADEATVLACARRLLAEERRPDALVVMGGYMPAAALPAILGSVPRVRLGVLTENSGVLALRTIAYVASYSQVETGRMAFELLADVAAGRTAIATTRYSPFEILRPSN